MSDYKEEINIIQYLRDYMDIFEYKNYILGLIFYKYLSEKRSITSEEVTLPF